MIFVVSGLTLLRVDSSGPPHRFICSLIVAWLICFSVLPYISSAYCCCCCPLLLLPFCVSFAFQLSHTESVSSINLLAVKHHRSHTRHIDIAPCAGMSRLVLINLHTIVITPLSTFTFDDFILRAIILMNWICLLQDRLSTPKSLCVNTLWLDLDSILFILYLSCRIRRESTLR